MNRDMWTFPVPEILLQGVRLGLRRLWRNRGFTAVAVVTLALGISGTTAIFSVVNGVLLKPLPYLHPGRLVEVGVNYPGINLSNRPLSTADYFIFREQSRAFRDIGIYDWGINFRGESVNVTGLGDPQRVLALPVTDGVLPILGVTPLLGRLFTRGDDRPGGADTVMLTYGYWRSNFGGERSVIGKPIDIDGKPRTVIGVLPKRFRFLDMTNLAMLMPMKLNRGKTYLGDYEYGGIARLKRGVTLAEANADMTHMMQIVLRSFPVFPGYSLKLFEDMRLRPSVRPLKQQVIGDAGNVLWVLMGGIVLVLIIACSNVANLLLVRADGRQQELAIRAALGASRGRIAAELFSESLILAVLGGLLGLGLAYGALRVLVAVAPSGLPRLNEIGIDGMVVVFALALSVAASFLSGSVPVFRYAGARLGIRLRESGRSMSEGRERHRARGVLLITQVALALILMISSGLMIRTFRALTRVNPGFVTPSEVQTFRVSIPDTQVKDPERAARTDQEISQNLKALPGVSSVGVSAYLPMDGSSETDPVFTKDRVYAPGEAPEVRLGYVAPDFFKTLGTPLMAGHDFTWSDIYNERPVAMVSENFVREYWHKPAGALGKQIRTSTKGAWREIVGVVADVHQDGVSKEAPPTVYVPILVANFEGDPDAWVYRDVAFAIRSRRAASGSLASEVRRAVWSVDANLPLAEVHTLDYYYTKSMARTSFTLMMLAVARGMALLIGIVGLYGVIAYLVSQRTHEIGIRVALGAQKRDILRLVVAGGMSLTLIGVGVGMAAALALTRFLSSFLYGVKPTDALTFTAVSLILTGVALLACYIPARRATKVDPIVALRYE
jgi:predicted permease